MQPFPSAAPGRQPRLEVVLGQLALHHANQRRARRRRVLRVHRREELPEGADGGDAFVAEKTHPAVADLQLPGEDIEVPLGEVAAVERALQPVPRPRQRALGAALLGDVAADAAVAEEAPVRRDERAPRDDVHLARAALVGARDLEVEERLLALQALEVRLQRARLHLYAGQLPEALAVGGRGAEEQRHRGAPREPGDAVPGVGLPEPVRRELGEAAEALLALDQLLQAGGLAPRHQHHHEIDDRAGDEREVDCVFHGP